MIPVTDEMVERLIRPIIGIENRTAQEAFDIMADRFRALSEGDAPAPEVVAVKALEWREHSKKSNGCWTADSPFGTYSVVNEGGWWCVLGDGPFGKGFEWCGSDLSKDTLETAKAAAQADYERRIRSALVWNTIAPDWNVITPDWSVIAPTPIEQRVKALDDLASAYPGDTDGSIRAAISPTPEAVAFWHVGKWGNGTSLPGESNIFCDAWETAIATDLPTEVASAIVEAHNASLPTPAPVAQE